MEAIEITIFKHIFQSVCEEMGEILQYSAFSPNIKERQDFSCALFTTDGLSFAFGSHIPVHLGAMPLSLQAALREMTFAPGDMVLMNDPYLGGTHLPDLTLIAPVFVQDTLTFYVANRAHHSDMGGMQAGSMPLANTIYQEGLIIPPVTLVRAQEPVADVMKLILANVRTPKERRGDIMAQVAANRRGVARLEEICACYGRHKTTAYALHLIAYTERLFTRFINTMPQGTYTFRDYLDDDGFGCLDIPIQVAVTAAPNLITIDFNGSSPQVAGGVNANRAITYSAILYVLTSLMGESIPINSGIMRPVHIVLPPGSIVNAERPAAMAAGNVETSQRIVDVLLGALSQALPERIPAASQGTMNNITIGGPGFAYYETIGGGTGAGPGYRGVSGVHSHMTNSMNTPIEAIERDLPVRMESYSLRQGSGGKGAYRGGDGLRRSYRFLAPCTISLLSERRRQPPYGLAGGSAGRRGSNRLTHQDREQELPAKTNRTVQAGDVLCIDTPGGGGYGTPETGS